MSYRQHLDELNDMINTQFEQEGQVDVEPVMTPGNTYHIIRIVVKNGAHGSGTVYVQDWSFENGTRTTLKIQEAKVYSKEQAEHIISNESGRSSMIRVNAQMDTIEVNYGPVQEKHPDQDCWNDWMDSPEFDLDMFIKSMKIPSSFVPHRSRELTSHNQCHVETHLNGIALTVTVSYRGHASMTDLCQLKANGLFGFSDASMIIEGEGIGAFTVFTFTL